MSTTARALRRMLLLLVVLVCALGAGSGLAAGSHATSHTLAGSATPGHHQPGGHGPRVVDDGTQQRQRRRVRVAVVRALPRRARAAWVGLASMVRRVMRAVRVPDPWAARASVASSPTLLCVCRT